MPRKIKVSKKQVLKKPDEFITFSSRLIKFLKDHQKEVLIFTPIIIILVILLSYGKYYIKQNDLSAFANLSKILETEKDITKKKSELIKIREKKFTEASKYAAFYLASIYLQENDKEKAKKELDYAMTIKDQYFQASAINMMIDVLKNEKKYDEAISLIDKNLDFPSPFKEEFLFKKAQVLENMRKIEEAKKIYEQIEKNNKDFYLIKLVQSKK